MEDEQQIHEAQFMQLIMSLQGSAWMMLGKTMNPMTGKIDKNLEAAKSAIDTLVMLKAKTKGNLSKTEDDFLSNTLQQLQINFVEESKAEKEKPAEDKSQEPDVSEKSETDSKAKEEKLSREKSDDAKSNDKKLKESENKATQDESKTKKVDKPEKPMNKKEGDKNG